MRYLVVAVLGLLWTGRLEAQNSCYAWYDRDTLWSLFGRWPWDYARRVYRVYYVRPGGEYLWFGANSALNWSWWGSCGQGSSGPSPFVPLYINLSAGDSCTLEAVAWSSGGSGYPCSDSLRLLIIAHPGAWGHCYAQFSLNGTHRPPGNTYTLSHAGSYPASLVINSTWQNATSYSSSWHLSGPVSFDTTIYSRPLSSPLSLTLPLSQPGLYTLRVSYFVYDQASLGCKDTLRYYIHVLQDSTGWGCPDLADTLHYTLGSHTIIFPLGYATALYTWSLNGPSGQQQGSGTGDSIIVNAQFSSPGWHYLNLFFYSSNGYHCQVYIPIYVRPPTVPPCLSPTTRPCKPLVTINNTTLSPNQTAGFYALCPGRTYTLCVSPAGGYCPGLNYSWGYTYFAPTSTGGPFYQNCATFQTPANAFSSAFLSVWMTVRDSAGNIVCRDSTFIGLDVTPSYCGHPDSVNVGLNDSTYWPGDTITYSSPDTLIAYAIPTPITDSLLYTWQWSITPAGGNAPINSGISNIIPITVPAGNIYTLQITNQSQSHQRTRSYTFYINRRTSSLSRVPTQSAWIYPNPTTGMFYVVPPDAQAYTLYIYDPTGRKLLQAELNGSTPRPFSLPAGVYVIHLIGSAESQVFRLIVQP